MPSLRFCMTRRRGCLQLYPITVNKHFSLFNHAHILSAPPPPQPQPPMMIPHRSFSSLPHRSQQHERECEQCDNDQGNNKLPTTATTKVSSKGSWLRYTIDEQSHNKTIKEILTDHMLVSGKTIQKATRINGLFVDNRRPFLQHRGKLGQIIRILISKSLSSPSSPMTPSSSTVPNNSPAGHGNKQDSKKQLNDENDENAEGNLENRHHKQQASQFVKILYEDEHLLVVNKPPGVLMYPTMSYQRDTLVDRIRAEWKERSKIQDTTMTADKVCLVNRIDKDTSGLVLVAKNSHVQQLLSRQWQLLEEGEPVVEKMSENDEASSSSSSSTSSLQRESHATVRKTYLAIVHGTFGGGGNSDVDGNTPLEGTIRTGIALGTGGRRVVSHDHDDQVAITRYRVLEQFKNVSLVSVSPQTGRTHQIRVHMAHIGHPVLGDFMYGVKDRDMRRHALHSWRLQFAHPMKNGEIIRVEQPMPRDMEQLLRNERNKLKR